MQEPKLFHNAHRIFKQETGRFIKKYLAKFQWHKDGSDIHMDIGTGPGDVFMRYIYPEMPKEINKIICADISQDMLEFAQQQYNNPAKCEYRLFDVTSKEELPSDLKGKIHHLTVIHLMHWIKDYGKGDVLKTLYKLLHPDGGDCLIIFIAYHTILDAIEVMKNSSKWNHYFQDIKEHIPTSNYSLDLAGDFRLMLEEAGFNEITCEEKQMVDYFESYESYRDTYIPVCALLKYIPECQKSEFIDDFTVAASNEFTKGEDIKPLEPICGSRSKILVFYAKK